MDKLIFTTNYLPTSAGTDLALHKIHHIGTSMIFFMDEVRDSVILTRQQLEERDRKIAGDAFEAGRYYGMELVDCCHNAAMVETPDKEQYLSSLKQ